MTRNTWARQNTGHKKILQYVYKYLNKIPKKKIMCIALMGNLHQKEISITLY